MPHPFWEQVTVTATDEPTVTGNVFLPRTPEQCGYDADGNMTNDGRWMFTWDAENRLVKVESRADTPQTSWRRVEWTYDAKGRRIAEKAWIWTNGNVVVVEDLKVVCDPVSGGRHIAGLNATNDSLVRSCVWGLDVSSTVDGAGGVGGLLWLSSVANGGHVCAYDGNGNVVGLVSANTGTETARYEYGLPRGRDEPIRVTGPMAKENPRRFSTKRTDNTTHFVFYKYRAYNLTLGRWLSRNPIGKVGGKNACSCVLNDLCKRVDVCEFIPIEAWAHDTWQNIRTYLAKWIRDVLGLNGQYAAAGQYLKVWGDTVSGYRSHAYGNDSAEGRLTFATPPSTYRLHVTGLYIAKKDLSCVECGTYTSEYTVFVGVKTPYIDLSVTCRSSTISITICADGETIIH